jgi:hypothetical protein
MSDLLEDREHCPKAVLPEAKLPWSKGSGRSPQRKDNET